MYAVIVVQRARHGAGAAITVANGTRFRNRSMLVLAVQLAMGKNYQPSPYQARLQEITSVSQAVLVSLTWFLAAELL